jgi:type VI secretion system protein ImpH
LTVLSPYGRLLADPRRFRFDAAIRILTRAANVADPAEAARFTGQPGMAYPGAEVHSAEPPQERRKPRLTITIMGLTGAAGVLPRLYTDVVSSTVRKRSRAMADFLDRIAHRFIASFGAAGTKYRLHRTADQAQLSGRRDKISATVLALTGYGTPHLAERLIAGADPILHYAGFFAARPRSAERLAALVSDWLGQRVHVEQFAGAWLSLPPDQRSALPHAPQVGAFNTLGVDATIGLRAWEPHARVVLRIGPLNRAAFESMLPDRPALHRLVSLVRAFLGFEVGFAINPVLAGDAVPPLRLSALDDPSPRLGWNTWVRSPENGRRRPDAADASFAAELVEEQKFTSNSKIMNQAGYESKPYY